MPSGNRRLRHRRREERSIKYSISRSMLSGGRRRRARGIIIGEGSYGRFVNWIEMRDFSKARECLRARSSAIYRIDGRACKCESHPSARAGCAVRTIYMQCVYVHRAMVGGIVIKSAFMLFLFCLLRARRAQIAIRSFIANYVALCARAHTWGPRWGIFFDCAGTFRLKLCTRANIRTKYICMIWRSTSFLLNLTVIIFHFLAFENFYQHYTRISFLIKLCVAYRISRDIYLLQIQKELRTIMYASVLKSSIEK